MSRHVQTQHTCSLMAVLSALASLLFGARAEGNKLERAATHFSSTEKNRILLSLVPLPSSGALFPPKLTSHTPQTALDQRESEEVVAFDLWCCWSLPGANTLPYSLSWAWESPHAPGIHIQKGLRLACRGEGGESKCFTSCARFLSCL